MLMLPGRMGPTVAVLVGVVTFAVRYLTLRGFPNDHYVHLARVQQMLLGEWPVRDYTEEGGPLTTMASVAAQWLIGPGLWAEALLTITSLSIAAAITTSVTTKITGAVTAGAWAGILQLLAFPRSYSHPKMLLYAVAIAAACAYATLPGRLRLWMLAAVTGLAFLVRHDHGLYIGTALALVVFAVHASTSLTAAARSTSLLVVLSLLIAMPWLAYVASFESLASYFDRGLEISKAEAVRTRLAWPQLSDGTAVAAEMVNIRWHPNVTDADREATAHALQLTEGTNIGGRSWRYRLLDRSAASAHAIVTSPAVEDTMHIDRSARPGLAAVATAGNAAVVLYYTAVAIPLTLLIVGGGAWIQRRLVARAPASVAIGVGALGLIVSIGFLREELVERIADVFGVLPIACALLAAAAWNTGAGAFRVIARVAAVSLLATVSAATLYARPAAAEIASSGLLGSGQAGVLARAQKVRSDLTVWPWSSQWPAGDGWRLAEYAHRCTRPDDRVLATWNVPELNFFARRGFAGGEAFLIPAFRRPQAIESDFMRRVANESVPLVFIDRDHWADTARQYPAIANWLATNYQPRRTFTLSGGMLVDVMARAESPCGGV